MSIETPVICIEPTVVDSVVGRDGTERRRIELDLLVAGERYRLLAETMLQGVVHHGADGTIIAMNPAAEHILGKPPEQLLGRSSVNVEGDCIRADGSPFPGLEHPAMVALRTGELVRGVVMGVFNPRRGEYRWIRIDAVPLMCAGEPHLSEVYTIFEDITEWRQVQESLRESETRQRLAIAASNIGLWDWDLVTNRVVYSREYKAQLGYAEDELNDDLQEWESRVHPDDLGPILAKRDRFFQGREADLTIEFRMRHRDGSWHWILARSEPVRDADGRPIRILGCHIDITARKVMEQALQEALKQQAQLSRRLLTIQEDERKQLARELHDEIGQVLTAIRLNLLAVQLAMQLAPGPGSAPERLQERLRDSLAITDQAIRQVRARSLELRPSLLDDLGLIPAMEQFIERQTERDLCPIEFSARPLATRPPPEIEIACYRVMQEAVTNAVRHAGANRIQVQLTTSRDWLELVVDDDGCGFDSAAAHHRALAGGSFGLLGMEERATLTGGGIEFGSQPGRGCKIKAWFPLRVSDQ